MQNAHLSELERRAYRSVVDDGLLDILLGIFLLLMGLDLGGEFLEHLPWGFFGASPFVWKALRKRLIEPRTGHVQLHPSRVSRIKRGKLAVMALVSLYALALFAVVISVGSLPAQLSNVRALVFAAVLGSTIAMAGFLLEMRRWIGYAAIIVVAGVLEHVAGHAARSSIVISGSAVLALGFILLVGFLYRHPVMPNEASLDA